MRTNLLLLFIFIFLLFLAGCIQSQNNSSFNTSENQSIITTNGTTNLIFEQTTPIQVTPQSAPSQATQMITQVTPSTKLNRTPCGDNICPDGWMCCGKECYYPTENIGFECVNDKLVKKQPKTCKDIVCYGATSQCCDDYRKGPVCYDPYTHRCAQTFLLK